MKSITLSRTLNVKENYDVIVCGGGVSGVAAAVSASRRGMKTLLIEKSNILGGLATLGLVNLFVPMCNGRGKQIIFGLCEKWVRLSAKYGFDTIPKEWEYGEPKEPTEVRYRQRYSPYIFAIQLLLELEEAGVDLLYDCLATTPVMEENICKGVVTESKGGAEYYTCRVLIDTTGDCDILRQAGVPVVRGTNFFTYIGRQITLDSCRLAAEKEDIRLAFSNVFGGQANLWGDNQPSDVPHWTGLDVRDVTDCLKTNQKKMLENLKQTDKNSRDIASLPLMPQLRTTCRILGDYTLKVSDVYRHFDDSICAVNDFEHRDYLWEVPIRTITRRDYPNMLTAGRSASGEGYAWDILRVIPPAITTGEAAGEIAALAISDGVGVADVEIKKLQARLSADNVMIHFPDEYVPEDKTVILHGKPQNTDNTDTHF